MTASAIVFPGDYSSLIIEKIKIKKRWIIKVKDFFVSYTGSDLNFAIWVAELLEANNFSVTIQAWDFSPGDNFVSKINEALIECRKLVVILSNSYLKSKWCEAEWTSKLAEQMRLQERRIIPIRIEPIDLTGLLSPIVYIDIVDKGEDEAKYEILSGIKDDKPRISKGYPSYYSLEHKDIDIDYYVDKTSIVYIKTCRSKVLVGGKNKVHNRITWFADETIDLISLTDVFDDFMTKAYPNIWWERYADDGVLHCQSYKQAVFIKQKLEERFQQFGLELNKEKTRIVYCKDNRRSQNYSCAQFTFLGYTFRPRLNKNKEGKFFVGFTPAVSEKAKTAMKQKIREWKIQLKADLSLKDIGNMINKVVQGWINYYTHYYKSEFYEVLRYINQCLIKWVRRSYKKKNTRSRAEHWLGAVARRDRNLFAHWKFGILPSVGEGAV